MRIRLPLRLLTSSSKDELDVVELAEKVHAPLNALARKLELSDEERQNFLTKQNYDVGFQDLRLPEYLRKLGSRRIATPGLRLRKGQTGETLLARATRRLFWDQADRDPDGESFQLSRELVRCLGQAIQTSLQRNQPDQVGSGKLAPGHVSERDQQLARKARGCSTATLEGAFGTGRNLPHLQSQALRNVTMARVNGRFGRRSSSPPKQQRVKRAKRHDEDPPPVSFHSLGSDLQDTIVTLAWQRKKAEQQASAEQVEARQDAEKKRLEQQAAAQQQRQKKAAEDTERHWATRRLKNAAELAAALEGQCATAQVQTCLQQIHRRTKGCGQHTESGGRVFSSLRAGPHVSTRCARSSSP